MYLNLLFQNNFIPVIVHEIGAKLVSNWEQNMIYTKISKFYVEKDIYVNRLESVIFGM